MVLECVLPGLALLPKADATRVGVRGTGALRGISMTKQHLILAAAAALGLGLAGCAADGSPMLSTASIDAKQDKVAAVDPACIALSNQIETLRKEEAIDGLEKAATGKGASVKVKRDSLAKQAELNRTYADFQTKCGPKLPAGSQQASQVPAVTPIPAAAPVTKQQ